ncbi:hypothetical protein FKP32DRAFT_1676082 [Trametes sanguinea]|nr:hypothetical protein FKP32DRAFT_1676082 [Trametes sanguinea]
MDPTLTFGLEFEAILVRFKPHIAPLQQTTAREVLARLIDDAKRHYLQQMFRVNPPNALAQAVTPPGTPDYTLWNVVAEPTIKVYAADAAMLPGEAQPIGVEVLTPILLAANRQAWTTELRAVLQGVAQHAEWKTNRSTGLHIHVGRRPDNHGRRVTFTLQELQRIAILVCRFEDAIDLCLPDYRKNDNGNIRSNRYNRLLRGHALNEVYQLIEQTDSSYALAKLLNYHPREGSGSDQDGAYRGSRDSKYHKVNFTAVHKFGTVEFRQHDGTVSENAAIEWTDFILRFVYYALSNHPETLKANGQNGTVQELGRLFGLPRLFQEMLVWRRIPFQ